VIDELSIPIPCGNPFRSIQIRAIEVWFACIEALSCIEQLEEAFDLEGEAGRALGLKPCKGIGIALIEAPRGTLFQGYEIDDGGEIKKCSIIPPTAQNQHRIEDSLLSYLSKEEIKSDESLCHKAEVLIRSFDPCISCATHFLSLEVIRR
jgi:coenzyme F420-reducing hydrogenase alpha subunit